MIGHIGDAALPPDIMRMLRDLDRRLRELAAARRLESSSISGGRLLITDDAGTEIVLVGDITDQDGVTSRGWALRRQNDRSALTLFGDPDQQFWAGWDASGHIIVSDDGVTGTGLARPYLPVTWRDTAAPYKPTTSGSFAAIYDAAWQCQHPRIKTTLQVIVPVGTVGEWELRTAAGTVLDTEQVTGLSTFVDLFGAASAAGVEIGSEVTLQVRHRRVSGAGTVETRLLDSHGIQS